jgi:radical SAM superfamily enzyme YgiQ (UPF0313 family)
MKKIYFAQINNVISDAIFLPLSAAYVWEYCRSLTDVNTHWELGGIFFERKSVDEYLTEIDSPDVFAISTYVWNWDISRELARAVRERWPECLIVMGGPQVPYKKEWLAENQDICDYIITYAGERAMAEFLRGNVEYPGIMSATHYKTPKPDKVIDDIPSPYLSGLMDTLMEPGKQYSAIIETNRGCPYACTFCDQEAIYYNKITKFDYDRVIAEINWVSDHKIDFLYFADSNLGIFDRDVDFIRHLAKNRQKKGYPRQIDYATAKQQPERIVELGRILNQEAKIKRGVTIALQSMNPATLTAIKRDNIANTKLEQMVSAYNKAGVDNYCELIVGLPEETLESWIAGIGKILELGSDHALTVHPLSIVPNTPFNDPAYQEKYGLFYTATAAPAGGNVYPEDSKGEIDLVCHASNTFTTDEYIDMYFFAKGIVIPHHYHGVSQLIGEYLKKQHNIPLIEYYCTLYEYSKDSVGYLHREYIAHTSSLYSSLFTMETWGRPIPGSDNFHFQDNGATAAFLYTNIDAVHAEIVKLIKDKYNVDLTELASYNKHILDRYQRSSVSQVFEYNWPHWVETGELLHQQTVVTVSPLTYTNLQDHAKNIFWYGRKSKRCFLTFKHEAVV